jgi:hypothetical protein
MEEKDTLSEILRSDFFGALVARVNLLVAISCQMVWGDSPIFHFD